MNDEPLDFATRAIHTGKEHNTSGGVAPAIVQTSTFRIPGAREGAELLRSVAPERFYTRWGNPTTKELEEVVASLEGAEAALAFSSGMGAISALLFSNLRQGDHAVFGKGLYSATTEMALHVLPRYGIEAGFADASNLEEVRAALRPETRVLFVETPTNPVLRVCDLEALGRLGRERGILTVVDNTFASPYNQNPLRHGIDAVVHSMTKSMGGHSDVTAGAVVGSRELVGRAWTFLKFFGASLSPFEAWLLIRGLKTLALRAERQSSSALEVARFLQRHPAVERVHYPGLPGHPGHELARRQMRGFGGMLSFELRGGLAAGVRVVESVKLITLAASLGSAETLIVHPASMIHGNLPEEARREGSVSPGLLRLSVGLEAPRDLIADLEQALARAGA